nr:uncharacterized protein LOC131793920 [Pocillopora verrucosa]
MASKVCYFVGYAVKKSEEPRDNKSKFKALEAMIDYASQKSLTEINARGGENGCHVCLVLDGKSHGFPLDEESQILAGFIQVSGLKFYRDLCPNDKKDQWFAKFRALGNYKVFT